MSIRDKDILNAIRQALAEGCPAGFHIGLIEAIDDEICRRKHGPFTLAEAIASGRPFRRPDWKLFASGIGDCNDDGYMCIYFSSGPEPMYADDITATDYELAEGGE